MARDQVARVLRAGGPLEHRFGEVAGLRREGHERAEDQGRRPGSGRGRRGPGRRRPSRRRSRRSARRRSSTARCGSGTSAARTACRRSTRRCRRPRPTRTRSTIQPRSAREPRQGGAGGHRRGGLVAEPEDEAEERRRRPRRTRSRTRSAGRRAGSGRVNAPTAASTKPIAEQDAAVRVDQPARPPRRGRAPTANAIPNQARLG